MTVDQKKNKQIQKLLQRDRRTLSQTITKMESKKTEHRQEAQKLLQDLKDVKNEQELRNLKSKTKTITVGISGVPGVGKSTFIEALGLYLVENLQQEVVVLAIDPSSPVSGGSLMGDKTRMEKLSQKNEAFIRPSPTSGSLGGVTDSTKDIIQLCQAVGFDIILVETVGVGQSEYAVASLVDFFLMLVLPNAGDELQGIKRGITELADGIVVNKADGDNRTMADITQKQYEGALELLAASSSKKFVAQCSALNGEGIEEVWSLIKETVF